MRTVLIDDDSDTHEFLVPYLKSQGLDTFSAYDGSTGLQVIHRRDPDLVILDIQLPEVDGWEVCQRIRSFSNVPILLISAVAKEEDDIIRGLTLGGDDYLTKPIRLEVFGAHLRALLRRSTDTVWRSDRQAYIDDHLVIDLYRQQVYVKKSRVSLSSLEFRLLELLVRNRGVPVPTIEIVQELWADASEDDYLQYVRIYIRRLREIIEPDARNPQYIINEWGVGYRFTPHS